jgi:hypothetical protein
MRAMMAKQTGRNASIKTQVAKRAVLFAALVATSAAGSVEPSCAEEAGRPTRQQGSQSPFVHSASQKPAGNTLPATRSTGVIRSNPFMRPARNASQVQASAAETAQTDSQSELRSRSRSESNAGKSEPLVRADSQIPLKPFPAAKSLHDRSPGKPRLNPWFQNDLGGRVVPTANEQVVAGPVADHGPIEFTLSDDGTRVGGDESTGRASAETKPAKLEAEKQSKKSQPVSSGRAVVGGPIVKAALPPVFDEPNASGAPPDEDEGGVKDTPEESVGESQTRSRRLPEQGVARVGAASVQSAPPILLAPAVDLSEAPPQDRGARSVTKNAVAPMTAAVQENPLVETDRRGEVVADATPAEPMVSKFEGQAFADVESTEGSAGVVSAAPQMPTPLPIIEQPQTSPQRQAHTVAEQETSVVRPLSSVAERELEHVTEQQAVELMPRSSREPIAVTPPPVSMTGVVAGSSEAMPTVQGVASNPLQPTFETGAGKVEGQEASDEATLSAAANEVSATSVEQSTQTTTVAESESKAAEGDVKLYMSLGQVRAMTIGGRLRRVSIADNNICQAFVGGANQIKLIGTGLGKTTLTIRADVVPDEPTRTQSFAIEVREAVNATGDRISEHTELLNDSIAKAFPQASVLVIRDGGKLLVTGECRDEASAKQILRMVRKSCLVPVKDDLVVR